MLLTAITLVMVTITIIIFFQLFPLHVQQNFLREHYIIDFTIGPFGRTRRRFQLTLASFTNILRPNRAHHPNCCNNQGPAPPPYRHRSSLPRGPPQEQEPRLPTPPPAPPSPEIAALQPRNPHNNLIIGSMYTLIDQALKIELNNQEQERERPQTPIAREDLTIRTQDGVVSLCQEAYYGICPPPTIQVQVDIAKTREQSISPMRFASPPLLSPIPKMPDLKTASLSPIPSDHRSDDFERHSCYHHRIINHTNYFPCVVGHIPELYNDSKIWSFCTEHAIWEEFPAGQQHTEGIKPLRGATMLQASCSLIQNLRQSLTTCNKFGDLLATDTQLSHIACRILSGEIKSHGIYNCHNVNELVVSIYTRRTTIIQHCNVKHFSIFALRFVDLKPLNFLTGRPTKWGYIVSEDKYQNQGRSNQVDRVVDEEKEVPNNGGPSV